MGLRLRFSDKVLIILSATLLVVFAIGAYLIAGQSRQALTDTLKSEARVLSAAMQESIVQVMDERARERAMLQEMSERLGSLPGVSWVEVFDRDATVIAHTDSDRIDAKPLHIHVEFVRQVFETGSPVEQADVEQGQFDRFVPVFGANGDGDTVVGVVELVMKMNGDQEAIRARSRELSETVRFGLAKNLLGSKQREDYLQDLAESFGRLEGVRWVQVLTPEGVVLSHSDPGMVGLVPPNASFASARQVFAEGDSVNQEDPANSLYHRFVPIRSDSAGEGRTVAGVIELAMDTGPLEAKIAALRRGLFLVGAVSVLILWATLAWFFRVSIALPIRKLGAAMKNVSQGKLSERITVAGNDEFGQLASSFNYMAGELQRITVSQDHLNNIVKSIHEALLVVSPEGAIQSLNSAGVKLFGYEEEELIGQDVRKFFVEDDLYADVKPILDPGLEEGGVNAICRTKQGRLVPVEVSRSALHGAGAGSGHTLLVVQDLRERIRTERALKESEARYRAITDFAAEGVVTIDETGTIESFNQAASDIFGFEAQEVIGRNVTMLMPEPFHSSHDGYIRHYLETGERRILERGREVVGLRRDGMIFPMDLAVSEITLIGKRLFSGIVRDISENKDLEEQLRQSQKMEAVGRLAGGMAHDFNNLLTGILGYSELLLDGLAPDDPMREDIEEIDRAGKRGAELVSKLLAFGRKQVLQPQVLEVNTVIQETGKMVKRVIGEDIRLAIRCEPDCGSIRVDPGQMQQMLLNLAINARDAMPEGGKLIIETALADLSAPEGFEQYDVTPGIYSMISISDDGEGMNAETKEHIFEPFFTTKEVGKGTGLGLSSVYGIVTQSQGNIRVDSELGKGTTFKVFFPVVDADLDQVQIPSPATEAPSGSETILLVEDDPAVRRLMRRALAQGGYRVVDSGRSSDALRMARESDRPIDILLTDVVMPEMDGRELADSILHFSPKTKIIFMSGYTGEIIAERGIFKEDAAFLPKPFTPPILLDKIREVLATPISKKS